MRAKKRILAGLLLLNALPLAGCTGFGFHVGDGEKTASEDEAQMAFQLVTAASMVPGLADVQRAIDPEHQAIIDRVEEIEIFFLNSVDSIQISTETSDKSKYQVKEVVTYQVTADTTETLTFYYNTTVWTEVDSRSETETTTYLTGVVVIDSSELPFLAKREDEKDREEVENSTEVTVFTGEDRRSYIRSSVEMEEERDEYEESYEYTYVSMGKVVSSFELEMESERNSTEKEVEIREGDATYQVKIESTRGRTFIRIETGGSLGRTKARYERFTQQDGNYTYERIW